ncbi:MAG TPA: hypothetical protein VHO95_09750 [Candidatus Dormibacteraeota bacterium]|nr:hypothetical protein [Candidatus Dormibacteraeota bacterium]
MSRIATLVLPGMGVLGGALFLLVGFATQLPGPGDSWTDWIKWSQTHPQAALAQVGLWALTPLALLVFGVYLAGISSTSHGWAGWLSRAALVALGIRAAVELAAVAIVAVAATGAGQGSMADFGGHLYTASLLPHAVFLTTLGAAMLIARSVPRWVGWLTLGVGVVQDLAPVLLVLYLLNLVGFLGPIPNVYGPVWYLSLPLWPLITGGALVVVSARKLSPRGL